MNSNLVPFTVEDYLPKPDSSSNDNTIAVISLFIVVGVSSISIYAVWKLQNERNKLQAELEKQQILNINNFSGKRLT
jgi:heme/copper-type cytochrome/quinol oxidase subunit 2